MSKTKRLLTPLESVQIAWGLKLRDFRQWCQPTTQGLFDWKSRQLKGAIKVAKSNMMNEVEQMLKAVQQSDNAKAARDTSESGSSVYLPIMVTAINAVETPPEYNDLVGQPQWMMGVAPNDPLQRVVEFRTVPAAYRCQIAFFAPEQHTTSAVSKQLISFFKHEAKRRFDVRYEVGFAGEDKITDAWNFRVLDNSLYPDKADIDIDNMSVILVDCVLVGLEPVIVGLGAEWDPVTDTGEPDGSIPPGVSPLPGHRQPDDVLGKFVIEADVKDKDIDGKTRVTIDPETRIITQKHIGDGE